VLSKQAADCFTTSPGFHDHHRLASFQKGIRTEKHCFVFTLGIDLQEENILADETRGRIGDDVVQPTNLNRFCRTDSLSHHKVVGSLEVPGEERVSVLGTEGERKDCDTVFGSVEVDVVSQGRADGRAWLKGPNFETEARQAERVDADVGSNVDGQITRTNEVQQEGLLHWLVGSRGGNHAGQHRGGRELKPDTVLEDDLDWTSNSSTPNLPSPEA
jgi:hypothetical protein